MEAARRALARALARLDGRRPEPADQVRAMRLILELHDEDHDVTARPEPLPLHLQVAGWQRDIAKMHLAEREVAETLAAAALHMEAAA